MMDQSDFTNWEIQGVTGLEERARAKLLQILEHHKPAPLPAETATAIADVLAGVEASHAGIPAGGA